AYLRHNSFTAMPRSASLRNPMICPSLNLFFTSDLPFPGVDSKPKCYSKAGRRRADAHRVCPPVGRSKGRYNSGKTLIRTATQGEGTSRWDVFLRDSQAARRYCATELEENSEQT